MKLNQKAIQYILLLLIVVIGFCAYQFGYMKYVDKANGIKDENKSVEARINELTEKEGHRDEWTKAIQESDIQIKELLSKYGPGNTPEKSIMFVRSLEDAAQMLVSSISFTENNVIFVSNDVDENGIPKVEMDSTSISINYNTSYDGLKSCMDFICNYPERMNVSGFAANYDQETGLLAGNMTINLYGVRDNDHNYSDPYIGGVELGTENIFGATGTVETNSADLNELNNNIVNTDTNSDNTDSETTD